MYLADPLYVAWMWPGEVTVVPVVGVVTATVPAQASELSERSVEVLTTVAKRRERVKNQLTKGPRATDCI